MSSLSFTRGDRAAPRVRVVIVAFASGRTLSRCLMALCDQTVRDFEVVVVDNCSPDPCDREIELPDERFSRIHLTANLGFAGGCNRGADGAATDWLAMLNPDAYPAPDWLERLLEATCKFPEAVAFGSTQLEACDPLHLDGCGDQMAFFGFPWRGGKGWPLSSLPATGEVFGVCAAASLYRRDIFEALGGFDETLFCYCEDVDLSWRMRLQGHSIVQVSRAMVRHEGGGVTPPDSPFSWRYNVRNRTRVFLKNMPTALLVPLLPLHLAAVLLTLVRHCRKPTRQAVLAGTLSAFHGGRALWKLRRDVQAHRRVSLLRLMKLIEWNPLRFARKAPPRGRRA